ncbi:MAG: hypothetical protein JNM41_12935 [Flavipsychrobacter sp.]|nr:hypothetical protein [Flavipsychrobacter sp.]
MVFELPVTGSKVKPQQLTALHLFCGLAFLGTGAIIYVYNFEITYWGLALLIAGQALITVTIAKNRWITGRKVNKMFRFLELAVALAIAALSFIEQWKFPIVIFTVLVAAIVFSLYWERDAGQQLQVRVDESGVHLPVTARRRFIAWKEIDQVMLRYGVLSIDCIDNKLFQFDVSATTAPADQFNEFCAGRVTAAIGDRPANDW